VSNKFKSPESQEKDEQQRLKYRGFGFGGSAMEELVYSGRITHKRFIACSKKLQLKGLKVSGQRVAKVKKGSGLFSGPT